MNSLILNADDYAMDGGVDASILALAERGLVSAASAMVLSPFWCEAGRRLGDVKLDRGLHLDLTSPFAAAASRMPALPRLMGTAFLGRLDRSALRHAIGRQLDLFESVTGSPPDFVDGHQHVHQLPAVRETLMMALKAQYGAAASQIGIRSCLARRWRGLKAAVIAATGAGVLARLARQKSHPINSDFAGVYSFSPAADLAALWRAWLRSLVGERPLVMCHPATNAVAGGPADPIRAARIREWHWLGSPAFRDLCAECTITFCGWPRRGNTNGD